MGFFSKNMDSPPWNLPDSNCPSQAESDLDQSHPRMENKIQAPWSSRMNSCWKWVVSYILISKDTDVGDVVPFSAALEHPYASGLSERDLGGAKCWDHWKRGSTLRTPCLKAWNRLKPTMCSWCNMTGSFRRTSPWHRAKFLAFSNNSRDEAWLV